MQQKSKKVEEVFSDYKTKSNIKYAEIVSMNILKKTNTLQVILYIDEYIEIKEIWYFENFLKDRFKFEHIDIQINYHEKVEKKSIEEEWKNIIAYMSHKYPLTKPMLLLKSDKKVEGDTIKIELHIKGAEFLKAKKTDKELQKTIKNLFGKEYKIELTEKISLEDLNEINKTIQEEQAKIIAHIEQENVNYMPPINEEGYIPEEMQGIEQKASIQASEETAEEKTMQEQEYIMGKPSKVKEKHIKIKEITANDGRVTLEGRIVTIQVKETKSGKGMIIFDLYDGTGTITCKSFAKDYKEGQEIVEKIETAKIIKTIGKAGLDTYAGDVTVIVNTIIISDAQIPELPKEEEIEDTPLILGNNINITDPLVKVADLGVDDGKIALQGEVIYTEDRTLKSGKTLFSFDLYDGTSTITCKAFLEKDVAKKKMKRIQNAKGLKVSGTAQMDSFSNELTVMANTIVETEGLKKDERQDKE